MTDILFPPNDTPQTDAIRRIAARTGPMVVGMLAWTDPTGRWWIAPLGSAAPAAGKPPPAWIPIELKRRSGAPR
jgi:hypothetical protein